MNGQCKENIRNIIVVLITVLQCCYAQIEFNQCISNILKLYNESTFVYLIKEEGYFIQITPMRTVFMVNYDSQTNPKVPLRPDFYLIQISSVKNVKHLEQYLTNIYFEDNWNSDAQVLIIANNTIPTLKLFELTWKFYFKDVLILLQNFSLYTYFPISHRNCSAYSGEYLGNCTAFSAFRVDKEQTSTYRGCMIRGPALLLAPFTLAEKAKGYPGVMQKIIYTFSSLMNCEYSTFGDHSDHGSILSNGTFINYIGELKKGNIDLISGINFNRTYLKYFEVIPLYIIYEFKLWAPVAKQADVWLNLVMVFSWIIWILILVSLCAVVCCSYIFREEETGPYKSFSYCILALWGKALGDFSSTPQSGRFKYLIIVWTFATFILCSAYQCYITFVMFVPRYKEQINSIQTLLDSKLPIGGSYFPQEFLWNANTNESRQLLENYHVCSIFMECVERAAEQRDMVALKDTRMVMYIWPSLLNNGEPMLYWFYEDINMFIATLMTKGHPLKDRMKLYMMRCLQTGLLQRWDPYNVYPERPNVCTKYNYITVSHLLFPFLLLVAGTVLASATFMYEISRDEDKTTLLCKLHLF